MGNFANRLLKGVFALAVIVHIIYDIHIFASGYKIDNDNSTHRILGIANWVSTAIMVILILIWFYNNKKSKRVNI